MASQRGHPHTLVAGVLFAAVATLVGALGCNFDIFPNECRTDGDCSGGKKCWQGFGTECKTECKSDSQCPPIDFCDTTSWFSSFPVCKEGCRSDDQCEGGTVCSGGQCKAGCYTDDQCKAGEACHGLDSLSLGDGLGTCAPGCRGDSECEDGARCLAFECVQGGCRINSDCADTDVCPADAFASTTRLQICSPLPAPTQCGTVTCESAARQTIFSSEALPACCPPLSSDACGLDLSGAFSTLRLGCVRLDSGGTSDPACPDTTIQSEPLKGCRATTGECGHFLDHRALGDAGLGCFVGL